jgi:glycosyltransferase involved in cell wall biosynthesis
MRKLRVGVWLNDTYKAEAGGGFGYYYGLIKKISTIDFKDAEIVFLSMNNEISQVNFGAKHNLIWRPYRQTSKTRIINFVAKKFRIKGRENHYENKKIASEALLKKELNKYVDVIYYPFPGCVFPDFPYIYTLWDLGHLSMYSFPEVSMNNVFEERKLDHDHYPHRALMIFAESNAGKKDIIKYLKINEERIKVIPLFPSGIVHDDVTAAKPLTLGAHTFFIHYPAQYWAHKNHFNLLIAFRKVIEKYPDIKLILTGSDKGNKTYVQQLIKEYDLENHIIELGFVSNEELKWLYLNSQGLVMPTFLGPTNMPLLEAAELGCPIACSGLEGHIEQLGDYGYYFDPKNPEEIAGSICKMIEDKTNNIKRTYISNFNINNALIAIDQAFSDLKHIRFCWGSNDNIF